MKNKRVILHIGTPKTGSTSIQESLGNTREVLLEHDIHYPGIKPYNHIFNFIPIFLDDPYISFVFKLQLKPTEDKFAKVQRYRKTWEKEILSCAKGNFIISAEDFTLPYFTKDAVRRLKKFVDLYFEEVTIIVYVRHYDQWISSQIQEAIKNGMRAGLGELVENLMKCPPRMSYKKILQKWIRVFGQENLVVRPFDTKAFYNDRLLDDFFHGCKLSVEPGSIPEIRSNESIGKNAAVFLQAYNQIYPRIIDNKVNQDRGLAEGGFPFDLYRNITDEKFKLELVYTPEQAQKFNEEIDYVNKFFSDGYQFHKVSPGKGELKVPSANDIPMSFFIELVNNYNKQLGHLRRQNISLREQIASLQRNLELLRMPLLLRIINKIRLKQTIKN